MEFLRGASARCPKCSQMPLDAWPVPLQEKSSTGHLRSICRSSPDAPRGPLMAPRCPEGALLVPHREQGRSFSYTSGELPSQRPSQLHCSMTTTEMIMRIYKPPANVLEPSTPPDFYSSAGHRRKCDWGITGVRLLYRQLFICLNKNQTWP